MKKIIKEFGAFINRGNVVDMAVGVMIGAAFKSIVDALVNNIISPFIGLIFKSNFDNITLDFLGVNFGVGAFITTVINFLIVAAVLFFIVKMMGAMHKKKEEPEAEPTTKTCPYCKSEIPLDATRCAHCTSEV